MFVGETPGTTTDRASYRANVAYNGDRYGVTYEKLRVGKGFNPEVGFLRRSAFDREYGALRFSPRPKRSKRGAKSMIRTEPLAPSSTVSRIAVLCR